MAFVSYAQNMEDVLLWRALKGVRRGFYIDVGAFSPDVDSVTRAFSERGWRGINIEPNPHFQAQLAARRHTDVNLEVAASDADGFVDLHVLEDTGLTTLEPALADAHGRAGWRSKVVRTRATTLASLWRQHVPSSQPVHFLKVDVEGHEDAVLRGMDWSRHRPWIVLVEAVSPDTHEPTHQEWHDILARADYDFVYFDGLNRFYVAREHGDLAAAFDVPPNVFDDYVLASQTGPDQQDRSFSAEAEARLVLAGEIDARNAALEEARRLIGALSSDKARMARDLAERDRFAEQPRASDQQPQRRPIWGPVFFHTSGKPRKAVRRLLFHTQGRPRGFFRRWILERDGRPREPFRRWMTSSGHVPSLPALAQEPSGVAPSPRTRYFLRRFEIPQAVGPET